MRDPRLSLLPETGHARHSHSHRDDDLYADMPPLIGGPSTSATTRSLHQGTTDRNAASRFAAATTSSSSTSAMTDSRRTRWSAEQEILQRSFDRVHAQRNDLLRLPYPTPPIAAPQPPPSAVPIHRVYVLRCATCDTFLSDRGMRAVLLLKPHIILFSTDSSPSNSTTFWPDDVSQDQVERTCECLTSSINCHGCGKTVGYNIVSPCSKCNASVQKHQRSANHHRFVFHHNEVTARERTYYPGEPGVSNPIVRVQPTGVTSREGSRSATPLARTREADALEKDGPLRSSRVRTISPAPRGRDRGLRLLKAGDTVYWHMLVAGGERCESIDPKTRAPVWRENEGR